MARKPVTDMSAWPSLTLEGNLIAPAMIAQFAQPKDDAETWQSYGIRKGLTIREEISTAFRVGQSHYDAFAKLENPSVEATRRFIRDFLRETFDFDDLVPAGGAVSFLAGGRVPVVVVPPSEEKLDRRSPTLSIDRSRSPAFALQDYLNEHDEVLWGLVTNGTQLRLMRDNASLTRPAYIETDLAQIFSNEDAASFATLWLLIHRTRFGLTGNPAANCALERWREAGSREGAAARDRLAIQVQTALEILGSGFLEANPELAAKLKLGEAKLTEWFNELLRLVYRLIFLMVAEDRNLLHPSDAKPEARKLYAEGYGLGQLRTQCVRATTWDRHHDRYEGVKIVFRALARGQEALGLPALGGLFTDDNMPHLETARLRNRAFMEALYRLSWLSERTGIVPVNWRAMETEELGSVYESLLELQPQLGDDGKSLVFASEAAEQKGNQRKTTGSYYTPDSLVQALLDTALDPVLDKTEAEASDPANALLKLSVIDPACGSGHFLLAAARRIATRLARIRAEGTPSLADFRHALRDVARSCIHGVDRNPMAVELTKVALWIETVDPGLPLGFFDAQIRCGDALFGVFDLKVLQEGIPDAAYKPLTGDDKAVARHYAQKNKRERAERDHISQGFGFNRARDLLRDYAELRAMPENSLPEIEAKAARLKALTRQGAGAWILARACDLYVSSFLLPKRAGGQFAGPDGLPRRGTEIVPTSGTMWEYLRGVQPFGQMFGAAINAACEARTFHWPLEFPDVMQRGGFDVVLGNPPWERIKLQEQEFFAARSPEIAGAPNKAARERLIKSLEMAPENSPERILFDAFRSTKREAEATSEFVRTPGEEGGRFPLTGRGDVNTYALFAELFADLARDRAGVIVPTGIATDATTAPFFSALVEGRRLAYLLDFENRARLFPAVDSRMKFCIFVISREQEHINFCFSLTDTSQLYDRRRWFSLKKEDLQKINPNTLTAPVFRSALDAEITKKIYSNSEAIHHDDSTVGNSWGAQYVRLIDFGDHSGELHDEQRAVSEGFVHDGQDWVSEKDRLLPVWEAKLTNSYDLHYATFLPVGRVERISGSLESDQRHRYWVREDFFEAIIARYPSIEQWMIGYRDVARANDERTMIALAIPRNPASRKLPVIGLQAKDKSHLFLANLNSLALDFVVRQKITGISLGFFVVKQLPVLPTDFYTAARTAFVTPKVLELTYTSHALAPFAHDLGQDRPPYRWDEDRRAHLRAELDAFYARAYGLTRDELRYILDPTDVKGPDYPSETFRVLKEKEIRQYGEYRTRRLVLAAWDRMVADGTFDALELGADEAKPATQSIRKQLLPLDQLSDGAWARANPSPHQDPGAVLAAILKALDGPTPIRTVRLAAAMMLEPHLLTPLLPGNKAAEWERLVGREAEPRTGNVVGFAARTSPGWGTAIINHRGNSRLIEDLVADTWAPGPGLEVFETTGWPDGRAAFVLDAVRALDFDTTASSMPDEIRSWIAHVATA